MEKAFDEISKELHTTISYIFDVEPAKEKFDELVAELKKKETKLREILFTFESTRKTLETEIRQRENEEDKLKELIEQLRDNRLEIDKRILSHEQNIENLAAEREKLSQLIGRIEETVTELLQKLTVPY